MHLLLSLVIYRRFVPPEEYMVMQFEWQIYWWPQTHTQKKKSDAKIDVLALLRFLVSPGRKASLDKLQNCQTEIKQSLCCHLKAVKCCNPGVS